jgi:hypothetical protein
MTNTERVRHNYQRMKVLKALNEARGVGREIDFDELLDVCDAMNAAMVPATLDFHLRYMALRGWVSLRIGRTKEAVDAILGVTLTDRGVDRIDIGRMPELEG